MYQIHSLETEFSVCMHCRMPSILSSQNLLNPQYALPHPGLKFFSFSIWLIKPTASFVYKIRSPGGDKGSKNSPFHQLYIFLNTRTDIISLLRSYIFHNRCHFSLQDFLRNIHALLYIPADSTFFRQWCLHMSFRNSFTPNFVPAFALI